MIQVQHRQLALFIAYRGDEQVIPDLNFYRAKLRRDSFTQSFSVNNVPTFHRDDFVFGNVGYGK
jgi:hypothetical protein